VADGDTVAALERAASATQVELDFYGLRLRVGGDWADVVEELGLDFSWFSRPPDGAQGIEVVVERGSPGYDNFGDVTASFVTPRNVVYQQGDRTIVDYFGRAVSVLDRTRGSLYVRGLDKHLVHEAAYHFILSRAGQHLDARGLPRLHSLALASPGGAIAVLLPSGGGKSTLALRALEDHRVRILAEDTALIDRRGRLHPFPLRIGINATDAVRLPADHVRRIERMESHPKLALNPAAFADRIEQSPRPLRHLVIGQRSLGRGAELEAVGRATAVGSLLREAVVGVGVYQGMEFLLQRGMRDVTGKAGVAWTRAACCGAGLARAKVWRLTLGRDHERNWAALAPLFS
jgi:hypothetical protein